MNQERIRSKKYIKYYTVRWVKNNGYSSKQYVGEFLISLGSLFFWEQIVFLASHSISEQQTKMLHCVNPAIGVDTKHPTAHIKTQIYHIVLSYELNV